MNKEKALNMAIEALQNISESLTEKQVWFSSDVFEAINACKEALEQPAWQGLTDDEIDSAWSGITKYGISGVDFTVRFARAIEQALKEKNSV